MAYKGKLIGAALAASLAATASIALAGTGGQATQSADQHTTARPTGHMTQMAEHCNAMMKTMWQ